MSELVVFIDFDDEGRPFRVETSNGQRMRTWDFEWCKRDETLYYEQVGSGPDDGKVRIDRLVKGATGKLWLHPDYRPVHNANGRRVVGDLAVLGWERVTEEPPDPFETDEAREGDTVYCSTRDDHLPTEDHCAHVWWCDSLGWWRGTGDESDLEGPCDDDDCDGCAGHREPTENDRD